MAETNSNLLFKVTTVWQLGASVIGAVGIGVSLYFGLKGEVDSVRQKQAENERKLEQYQNQSDNRLGKIEAQNNEILKVVYEMKGDLNNKDKK